MMKCWIAALADGNHTIFSRGEISISSSHAGKTYPMLSSDKFALKRRANRIDERLR
jgi:hypothetical protein